MINLTGICGWAQPWQAIIIGAVGAMIACYSVPLLELMRIDDPVGSISIHLFPAIWAMLATGLFLESNTMVTMHQGRSTVASNFSGSYMVFFNGFCHSIHYEKDHRFEISCILISVYKWRLFLSKHSRVLSG